MIRNPLLLSFVGLFLLLPLAAQAMPCHCFSARAYDPGQPAAADPYFLATAQNSFFSVVFAVEKKEVVLAKQMQRASAEELWVSHRLSQMLGGTPRSWQEARKASGSWWGALQALGADAGKLAPDLRQALQEGIADGELSRRIVDGLLVEKGVTKPEVVAKLRAAKAADAETILATLIACQSGQSPPELFQAVQKGQTTWGTLLLKAGIDGGNMVTEIRALLGSLAG